MSISDRRRPAISSGVPHAEIARRLRLLLKAALELAITLNAPDQEAETDCEALLQALQFNGTPGKQEPTLCERGSSELLIRGQNKGEPRRATALELVSAREREVLELIGRGLSNKQIARHLGIGPETVKSYIKRIFAKLHVERRGQAAALAQRVGWLGSLPVAEVKLNS
jgi:DNA-binding CsgD family transcriptional regulator